MREVTLKLPRPLDEYESALWAAANSRLYEPIASNDKTLLKELYSAIRGAID